MQYPASLAVTWQRSFQQLTPTAKAVLRLAAFLAPDAIPMALLESGEEIVQQAASLLADETAHEVVPRKVRDDLAELRSLSLISGQSDLFTMHRLMQEVVRNQIPMDKRTDCLELVLALVEGFAPSPPDEVRTWPVWDLLRPHAIQLLAHAERASLISLSSAGVMSELGLFFGAKGLYSEAEPLMRKALDIGERLSGETSPGIAAYLNNLGMLLKVTGRLEEAELLMRRSMEIFFCSADLHPYATTPINALALLLMDKQQWVEAEELLRRALILDQDMYGEAHTYVGRDLHNLALLLISTGRTAEAEPLNRRSLEILRAVHGQTHPRPARVMQVLATILRDLGRPDEAEPLAREALEIFEGILGPDHPMTQSARRDLDTLTAA